MLGGRDWERGLLGSVVGFIPILPLPLSPPVTGPLKQASVETDSVSTDLSHTHHLGPQFDSLEEHRHNHSDGLRHGPEELEDIVR